MHKQSSTLLILLYLLLFCLVPIAATHSRYLKDITVNNDHYKRPNFIVFLVDDLGYGDVGYNGHPTIETPNIDKMARDGMIFTQWYSGFHICSPSRASLLSGRLPPRTGCAGDWRGGVFPHSAKSGFPHEEITFAESLKSVGYKTKIIGKWHLGQRHEYLPFNHGFDEYYGIPYSVDMGYSPWDKNVDTVILALMDNDTVIEQPVDLTTITHRYTEKAKEFIKASTENGDNFVLYLPFNHVHTPNFVSSNFCNKTQRGRFGDAVAEMDHAVGEILQSLADNNVADKTMTFWTSDNGPWLVKNVAGGSAGLFRDGKHTNWEGGIRMPAVVHYPSRISAGSKTKEIAATYDIFPSMLKMAGIELPQDRIIDGKDLSPILFGKNGKSAHDCLYIYQGTPGAGTNLNGKKCQGADDCPGLSALRCGKYKMHWVTMEFNITTGQKQPTFKDPPILFNVEWDPSEAHSIDSDSNEFKEQMAYFTKKKLQHEETYKEVPNYIMEGADSQYSVCCDPNSQEKYPEYPPCTCNPENYQQDTCGDACLANGNCKANSAGFGNDYYAAIVRQ